VDTTRAVPQIDSAITLLENAGILVIASAGNFDIDACKVSPANAHRALIIGASRVRRAEDGRWRDVRVPNTAWGPCIDLFAPGDSVPLPAMVGDKASTLYWSGTSMAAGYASGAAALLLEAHPFLTPSVLERAMKIAATPGAVDQEEALGTSTRGRLLYVGSTSPSVLAVLDERPRWRVVGR
jgi:subtilisin family serine protease